MENTTHQQMNEVLRALRKLVLAVESGTAAGFNEASRVLLAAAASEASIVASKYRTAVSLGEHRFVFECPEDAAQFTLLSLQVKSKPDEWRAAAAKAVNLDPELRLELQQGEMLAPPRNAAIGSERRNATARVITGSTAATSCAASAE